jgi:hypothetical protein
MEASKKSIIGGLRGLTPVFLKVYFSFDCMNKSLTELYKDLTYFDYYGSSLIFLLLIIIVFFIISSYCYFVINMQSIKNDWPNQRCNPRVMPFAGFINKPDDKSINEFTSENFTYCSQNIINNSVGKALEPLTFVVSSLSSLAEQVKDSLNAIREMVNKVRSNVQNVSEEIMGRIMNITIPLQNIIIVFRDLIGKIQGTVTASLMTVLGSYYTLRSLMGSIATIIVRILIGLVYMIMILWLNPLGWAIAPILTTFFVLISIYMVVILIFLKVVLFVEPAMNLPGLKSCFDKNTLLAMKDGQHKKICDICPGDILANNVEITATFKLDATNITMYDLNGVIVSGTHGVNLNGRWIPIFEHPDAKKIAFYEQPYIYCLNTNTKTIVINGQCFCDWDEVYEDEMKELIAGGHVTVRDEVHKNMDSGFVGNTQIRLNNGFVKNIKDIQPRDVLENGEIVYGVVTINGLDVSNQYRYTVGNVTIEGGPNLTMSHNSQKSEFSKREILKQDKLYNLLTDKKTFTCEGICFYHYNAAVELFLQEYKDDYSI